ncbi:hypothetical protein [Mesorhizobium sp. 131-2-1]|jgi:hypothetical protein|nr:hypothetical protein [Mesorhizobium sp. 131-2-1]
MTRKKGNREARKPKQIKVKSSQPASISELVIKTTLPGKRR